MILCAALKITHDDFKEREDSSLIIPCRRHGEGYAILSSLGKKYGLTVIEEGFIDTKGKFYNRTDALNEVIKNGQMSESMRYFKVREHKETELYSEDLY